MSINAKEELDPVESFPLQPTILSSFSSELRHWYENSHSCLSISPRLFIDPEYSESVIYAKYKHLFIMRLESMRRKAMGSK